MANFTKFFRNGKTFSAFCRMRYGQSKEVWADTALWTHSGCYAIGLDLEAADAKFGGSDATMKQPTPKKVEADEEPAWGPGNSEWESERSLRSMEDYAAYQAAGCTDAYWEDRDAGYCY